MSKARELAELGAVYDSGALSNRNLIINGAMNVWQRGTSADTASTGDYMCDRWRIQHNGTDGNVDWDQETSSTPDGFAYALKVSMDASEASLDAGDYVYITQRFEGQDLQHLEKGTANAKKVTLSFWVKSSVASTYTASLTDDDNTRIIGKSYTISTANTWEKKVIVFDGDTSGAFNNDANRSLDVDFWIDAGTTFTSGTFSTVWASEVNADRVYDTTGWLESTSPTFYLTGVQLEVGSEATPFEHRSYGDELARCQRYYYFGGVEGGRSGVAAGYMSSSTSVRWTFTTPANMRASPTYSGATTPYSADGSNRAISSTSVLGISGNTVAMIGTVSGGSNHDSTTINYGSAQVFRLDAEL